jgi:FAD/FMN-containing dehydrogenase
VAESRGFEFFWFPHTDTVVTKTTRESLDPPTSRGRYWLAEALPENLALCALNGVVRRRPELGPAGGRLLATLSRRAGRGVRRGPSYRVFATARWCRFEEMEYSLPLESLGPALRALGSAFVRERFQTHFPVEVRWVRGDDLWLSPAHGRDSAFVAVHVGAGVDPTPCFTAVERIFLDHGGRPHWGKRHGLGAEELRRLYPRWDDFTRLRAQLDPDGIFLNPHLRRVFGVA